MLVFIHLEVQNGAWVGRDHVQHFAHGMASISFFALTIGIGT